MKLKVQTRMVYGRPLHYPMCDLSRFIARHNKRPQKDYAITDKDLKELIRLGFLVIQIPQFGGSDVGGGED